MNVLQKGMISLFAVASLTAVNAAQFEIMPTIGKTIAKKDTALDDSKVLFGIRGTAYATPNIGAQVVLETSVNNRTVDSTGGIGDTDIERGTLNVIYEGGSAKIRPYAVAGMGYEATHGASVKTTNNDSQAFYNAGVGVKFGLTDNVSLVTEVKGIHKVENDDDDIVGTIGVGVKLGGTEAKKPTCATPNALSLDQFAKMCKPQPGAPAAAVVPAEQMPVETMQTEPVIVEKPQPATETVVEEKTTACVVEVEAPQESADIPEGYYVQMAALFKGSGNLLTSKLERKNYPYVLYNTQRFGKDATLVLAGPYASRKEAAVALKYLKRLSRKAFIKKFP